MIRRAELDELRHPRTTRRRRTTDFVGGRNVLDRLRRDGIQVEIILLRAGEKIAQVRFVPDLKIPGAHLGIAVTLAQMRDEGADEIAPLLKIFRLRHVAVPPENRLGTAGQCRRHKTKFHEWFHADALEKIIKLVNVLPVVLRIALPVFFVNAHVVTEQTVHADVFKTTFTMRVSQLPLPVGAQAFVRPPGTDTFLEHRVQRSLHLPQIGGDDAVGGRRIGVCEEGKPKHQQQNASEDEFHKLILI
jgi:hypothetical protein